jgi:maltooligosyltrehalose trehalohydrolase
MSAAGTDRLLPMFRHRCEYGAEIVDTTTTRFRLWAPDAHAVDVVIEGRAWPMQQHSDGSFTVRLAAPPGTLYHYLIDGETRVPDPAARAQQGDVQGQSIVVDPAAYRWRNASWPGRPWHEAVICEIHVGLLGGFEGVRSRLQHFVDSGYSAIELMPVAEFPGDRNWGYDGVLAYAPEASYGSPAGLKRLIDDAHGLGLMVLLDVVYNHFGPDGNYLPAYAAAFFRQDDSTPWGAPIDFDRIPVRRFFIDNALLWLNEYRFDGLRFDAVHAIASDAFLHELSQAIRHECGSERYVHLVLENERNATHLLRHDFDAQWNDDGHNALHALLTGEDEGYYADYSVDPTAQVARVLGEGFAFQGEPDRRGVSRGEPSGELPPRSFVLFLQNHDQTGNRPMGERLTQLVPREKLQAAMALVALCPMVPMFFMGEEWGCRTPFLFFTSHREELAEKVREGRRAEFAHFAGFADPRRRAAIPDPNALSTFEASRPAVDDPEAARIWSVWFAELLTIRRDRLTPYLRDAQALGCEVPGPGALFARWRLGNGSILQILVNLGSGDIDVPPASKASVIYTLPLDRSGGRHSGVLAPGGLLARLVAGEH